MLPPLPRCSGWAYSSLISPSRVSLPRKGSPGRPAHRPFRGMLGVHSRCGLHTPAVTVFRDPLSEGFRHFVTSMPAPVASGWSESPGGPRTHWKAPPCHGAPPSPVVLLEQLKGIGPEIASVLSLEGLFRGFGNRRQLAAYAGLAPTPWRSGTVDREQGISKAGNPRLRSTMIEVAWLCQT